jgi:aspartate carbamoyltransferase catalytic subunit
VVNKETTELTEQLDEPKLDLHGFERPRVLLEQIEENLACLLELVKRPIVSARQFRRDQLLQLARLAARFETQPQMIQRPLTGKILISAFYEPSTRTRLSFESAWHRLGGDIMSITQANTTGIAKGETYSDVAEMLNAYGDVVVLRDSNAESVHEMVRALRIPIINGGNGLDEHPTQALADIYAMLKWNPRAFVAPRARPNLRLGIIGVPSKMRTVRSLLLLLRNFPKTFTEIVLITDDDEPFDAGQREELADSGLKLRLSQDFHKELPRLNVIYQNAILWTGDGFESIGHKFRLDKKSPLRKDAIVLHPLARGPELSDKLDATPHNWYFAQARGAVFVRMALLATLLKIFI